MSVQWIALWLFIFAIVFIPLASLASADPPPTHYGVIETSSGDLLRAGYCDFENDGSFDSGSETIRSDAPEPAKVRGDSDESQMHRWNGSAWVLVAQP